MKRYSALIIPCLLLAAALAFHACGDEETGLMTGIVEFVDVEGGCWRIAGNDNVNYEPINLPEEFQQDGLTVLFNGKFHDDMASICMVGRIIEILEIRKA